MTRAPEGPDGREPLPTGARLLWRELRARLSLLWRGSPWRDPALYARPIDGDDYWILYGRWNDQVRPERIHARLGWTQGPLAPGNELGLLPWTLERLRRDGRPKVLFYGDSYVEGSGGPEAALPVLLEQRLGGDVDVVHLGVGGYCAGQMHLLARETIDLVDAPALVLMGVMDFSFDRAVQSVRSYQKPAFEPDERGRARAVGEPIDPRPRRFFRRRRTSFKSFVRQAHRQAERQDHPLLSGFEQKAAVNRAIVRSNLDLCAERAVPLAYVLFQDSFQLARPDLREQFFRETLEALDVPHASARDALVPAASARGLDPASLYRAGHIAAEGNHLVADHLAPLIREWMKREPPAAPGH